ncbi:nucleotide-binding universal stress UspA family protein [Streptacidiphilus sp. MAP12-33]|uniref:universal stress protein n=1 Tax=Streptacidiphilus sp. MAP12-33 TaxID=3156266 RepID=UPI003515FB75
MRERDIGRVVVGVDDSLAGLRALREAVETARLRGMEVRAVRTYSPPPEPGNGGWNTWNTGMDPQSFATEDPRSALRRNALATARHVFDQAMGGVPHDVVVSIEAESVPLHQALMAVACRDEDLLVVAAPQRRHPWWPPRRSVARRCVSRAGCPVLIVPAPRGARELGGQWRPWHRRQRRRELDALLDELTT